jgi:hypothetical protein
MIREYYTDTIMGKKVADEVGLPLLQMKMDYENKYFPSCSK